jgi:hypothetical protein
MKNKFYGLIYLDILSGALAGIYNKIHLVFFLNRIDEPLMLGCTEITRFLIQMRFAGFAWSTIYKSEKVCHF